MKHIRLSFFLNDKQIEQLSDICADLGQVFFASVVLPSLGIGGNVNGFMITVGVTLTFCCSFLGLFWLRSPSTSSHPI